MKFPISMLRDYVATSLGAAEVGDLLTMAGFELEGIEPVDGEDVLDIKVVSNRGDGLSVFGLAREVLAKDPASQPTDLYRAARAGFENPAAQELTLDEGAATIQSLECLRFSCRAFEGVDARSSSPVWMQERLNRAGMRPISILVDLTNYVMLELGQPLHAFDRDKLAEGRIVVRHAKVGERLTTLNGVDHELSGQMMICDAEKPVGVPGVMGGLETEVSDGTTRLLLESANFVNTTVRKTRKELGLNTEASYRFERSVDPHGVVRAIHRFSNLLRESQPGIQMSNIVDHFPGVQARTPISLRLDRANSLLGMEIPRESAIRYLQNLGFELDASQETILVTPPSWRPDLVREIDLVEELGRVHGYERIPEHLPIGSTPVGGTHGGYFIVDLLRAALVRSGLVQIVSHSLRGRHPLDGPASQIGPTNPVSPEMAWLRNSMLPCLSDAAIRNGGRDLQLFEIGRVFGEFEDGRERNGLAVLMTGDSQPKSWRGSGGAATDFFTLKGVLHGAMGLAGIPVEWISASCADARFHPTRCSDLLVSGSKVGTAAQIHPGVAVELGLSPETYLAEINLQKVMAQPASDLSYRPISRNPSVRRDISFEVSKSVPYAEIERSIALACGDALERQWLFDVYEGTGIEQGNHSLSVAIQLRKHGSNFTDEEANQVREKAVAALSWLGARPR